MHRVFFLNKSLSSQETRLGLGLGGEILSTKETKPRS